MSSVDEFFEVIRQGGRPSMPLTVKACREADVPLGEVKPHVLRGDFQSAMEAFQVPR